VYTRRTQRYQNFCSGSEYPIKAMSYFCPLACACHSGAAHCPTACDASAADASVAAVITHALYSSPGSAARGRDGRRHGLSAQVLIAAVAAVAPSIPERRRVAWGLAPLASPNVTNACMCSREYPYCWYSDAFCYLTGTSSNYSTSACAGNCTSHYGASSVLPTAGAAPSIHQVSAAINAAFAAGTDPIASIAALSTSANGGSV
jgi:hypothetical protein